jgi:hypothetical protein
MDMCSRKHLETAIAQEQLWLTWDDQQLKTSSPLSKLIKLEPWFRFSLFNGSCGNSLLFSLAADAALSRQPQRIARYILGHDKP